MALLSPCGTGNLGDAAIQDAAIANLRKHLGSDTAFVGITLNPRDTEGRHRIAAMPLDLVARPPAYGVALPPLPSEQVEALSTSVRSIRERFAALLDLHAEKRNKRSAVMSRIVHLWSQIKYWLLAVRLCGHIDMLVIAGGGQFDDLWGGASGHPFALFKWTTAARVRRTPIVALSVGSGHISSTKTRALLRCVATSFEYQSYRDRRTARAVERLTRNRPRIVPDLALSRPAEVAPPSRPRAFEDAVIGIAPMAFMDPRAWPVGSKSLFARYVDELFSLIEQLVARRVRVVIFNTTPADLRVARDLYERTQSELTEASRNLVNSAPATSVDDVLATLGSVHMVVASRLHAVVLSTLTLRPVIAVACEWKVDRYMLENGLREMKVSFTSISAAALMRNLQSTLGGYDDLVEQLAQTQERNRVALDTQYELVANLYRSRRGGMTAQAATSQPPSGP